MPNRSAVAVPRHLGRLSQFQRSVMNFSFLDHREASRQLECSVSAWLESLNTDNGFDIQRPCMCG
jgi:hypothetical protein